MKVRQSQKHPYRVNSLGKSTRTLQQGKVELSEKKTFSLFAQGNRCGRRVQAGSSRTQRVRPSKNAQHTTSLDHLGMPIKQTRQRDWARLLHLMLIEVQYSLTESRSECCACIVAMCEELQPVLCVFQVLRRLLTGLRHILLGAFYRNECHTPECLVLWFALCEIAASTDAASTDARLLLLQWKNFHSPPSPFEERLELSHLRAAVSGLGGLCSPFCYRHSTRL